MAIRPSRDMWVGYKKLRYLRLNCASVIRQQVSVYLVIFFMETKSSSIASRLSVDSASPRSNSKACDQCYRCKIKCSMELSGCTRCQMVGSVCTYSLGKWMGRPKKSSRATKREALPRDANISKRGHSDSGKSFSCISEILNLQRLIVGYWAEASQTFDAEYGTEGQDWDMTPNTLLSPFRTDDFNQFGRSDCDSVIDYIPIGPSNLELVRKALTGRIPTVSNDLKSDMRTGMVHEDAQCLSDQLGATSDNSSLFSPGQAPDEFFSPISARDNRVARQVSSLKTTDTRDSQQGFGVTSTYRCWQAEKNKLAHEAENVTPEQILDISPFLQAHPTAYTFRCKCSLSTLRCLDSLTAIAPTGGPQELTDALQWTLCAAEEVTLCTTCSDDLIIMKCCFILGKADELLEKLSILVVPRQKQAEEGGLSLSMPSVPPSVTHDIRRMRRRAIMLFAGLEMLQDAASEDSSNLGAIQTDFLLSLAKKWRMLLEQ